MLLTLSDYKNRNVHLHSPSKIRYELYWNIPKDSTKESSIEYFFDFLFQLGLAKELFYHFCHCHVISLLILDITLFITAYIFWVCIIWHHSFNITCCWKTCLLFKFYLLDKIMLWSTKFINTRLFPCRSFYIVLFEYFYRNYQHGFYQPKYLKYLRYHLGKCQLWI